MTKLHRYIIATLLSLVFILAFIAINLPDGKTHIHFLDIGQGDAAFIQSPYGHKILVDGGPGIKVLEELSTVLPFYDRKIDLLILTHPDQDHIEGAIEVLKNYHVGQVLFTGIGSNSPFYEAFLGQLKSKSIPFYLAASEEDFRITDHLYLDIIHPIQSLAGDVPSQPNNSSIVFNLIYGPHRVLFTGDIEKEIEDQILESNSDLTAHTLKVAHHGSKTSSTANFLHKVQADYAVIQSELHNRHGHPHDEILDRLQSSGIKTIYRNDLQGRIHFQYDLHSLAVKTEKTPSAKMIQLLE